MPLTDDEGAARPHAAPSSIVPQDTTANTPQVRRNPVRPKMVDSTVQVRRPSLTLSPRYLVTIQNPESLMCSRRLTSRESGDDCSADRGVPAREPRNLPKHLDARALSRNDT